MEYHRLDLEEQGIESFEGLDGRSQACFLVINLKRNRLTNFEHFGTHPHLTELQLQHNHLQSFRGLTKQASLRVLCLQGCPIAAHPYYRLMALLTVGLGIEAIDGLPVTSQERRIAKTLGRRAALAVSYGWLLDLHPRTVDEYDALIDEYKRLRKDERREMQGRRYISVDSVLVNLRKGKLASSHGCDATTEQQLEERQRTITRLARRVAQLEGQLTQSAEGHVIPMLPPNQLELTSNGGTLSTPRGLFSATELAQVDTVTFTRGIQMRHNFATIQGDSGGLQRVCLQLDHATLTAQTFLTRDTLVQMPLGTLRVRHLRPTTLVVEDDVGGALGLVFDTLSLLHTVYKALFVLSSRPIPPLSAMTQRQLQEIAQTARRTPHPTAAITFPAATGVRPGTSCASSVEDKHQSKNEDESDLAPSAGGKATVSSEASALQRPAHVDADSSPASIKLDNVEDVPPLPAAFSPLSAGGVASSIVFSVESSSPAVAGNAVQSSAVLKSNSNIDFQSVALSNTERVAAGDVATTKPAEASKPASSQRSKLSAKLLIDSSASSDSVVFHTDDAKSDAEDSVVVGEARPPASASASTSGAAVAAAATTAAHSSFPLSKAPPVPRLGPAVPPRLPPSRKSQVNTPVLSAPASTTQRSTAGKPMPQAAPPRPPSTRSGEKSSLNSSVVCGSKSLLGAGESSITFRVVEDDNSAEAAAAATEEKRADGSLKASVAGATPTATVAVGAPRPRIPARFGALRVDSDSD